MCIVHSAVKCSLLAVRRKRPKKKKQHGIIIRTTLVCGHVRRGKRRSPDACEWLHRRVSPRPSGSVKYHLLSTRDADSKASTSISGCPWESVPAARARSPASAKKNKKKRTRYSLRETCTKKKVKAYVSLRARKTSNDAKTNPPSFRGKNLLSKRSVFFPETETELSFFLPHVTANTQREALVFFFPNRIIPHTFHPREKRYREILRAQGYKLRIECVVKRGEAHFAVHLYTRVLRVFCAF